MGDIGGVCRIIFDICMIPKFPELKRLEQSDKDELEGFVKKYEVYSDFNFVSMWVYDTKEILETCWLNKNLVVKFQDYLTTKPFFSMLGNHDLEATATDLINFSKEKLNIPFLKLVPEIVAKKLIKIPGFVVNEDPDNNDYLVKVADLAEMKGGKYMKKRNHIHGFERDYGSVCKIVDINLSDKKDQETIINIFLDWETSRGKVREDTQVELDAVKRLFMLKDIKNILCLGLMVGNKIIGFSICEILEDNNAIYHFEKADIEYRGVFAYLKFKTAQRLFNSGVLVWNLEQDLGDPGLRISKTECRPFKMLKKYTVSINDM